MCLVKNEKNIISSEFQFARRENGLTIRYLAQCLINDLVFPNQDGIICLLKNSFDGDGNNLFYNFSERWEYWFLFHLEDFGSGDKSEIDILLKNGNTLFSIEVKAFTDPNTTDVKREIIRNYFTLLRIIKNSNLYFSNVTLVYPVLIYSIPVYEYKNPSSKSFNYFNSEFLYKQGSHQKDIMSVWSSSAIKNPQLENNADALTLVKNISKKLLFLNWNNILDCILELNHNEKFSSIITEMRNRKDKIQNVRLISKIK